MLDSDSQYFRVVNLPCSHFFVLKWHKENENCIFRQCGAQASHLLCLPCHSPKYRRHIDYRGGKWLTMPSASLSSWYMILQKSQLGDTHKDSPQAAFLLDIKNETMKQYQIIFQLFLGCYERGCKKVTFPYILCDTSQALFLLLYRTVIVGF